MYQQNYSIISANDSKQNPFFGTTRICILKFYQKDLQSLWNFFLSGEIIIVEIELYLFSNISFKRIVRVVKQRLV